ncbi:MAG: efflux RND transporter periplasmic adaptor subunit [Gammaproteobacteria bacterium]|nr:efflux RND transporter periplasmic adaptor subunit [Gammaproteobacteria bacterium]
MSITIQKIIQKRMSSVVSSKATSCSAVLILCSGFIGLGLNHHSFAEDDAKPTSEIKPVALVKTQRPTQQVLADTMTAYGTLQNDPNSIYTVSLPQAGQIERIAVSVGQRVQHGKPLVIVKTDPQVVASTTQARSAVTFAQGEQQRIQALVTARLATQSQLATATKALTDANATLQALQQQGGQYAHQTLTAPADALVMSISNQVGERLPAGAAVMQLSKTGGLQALIGVTPDMVAKLHAGMTVNISVLNSAAPTVSGVLMHTDGVVNSQTGRIDLPIRLSQPLTNSFRAGLPIKAEIKIAGHKSWVVPRNAVLQDEQGSYIYQIKQNHAVRTSVQVGLQTNANTAISGAINPNLNIVTLGNYTLQDGMAVREQAQ